MRLTLTLLVVGVLLGLPASAADWIKNCAESATGVLATSSSAGVRTTTALRPGQFACAETITNNDDTPILNISDCAQLQIFQFDDPDGNGTTGTVTGTPQLCPSPSVDTVDEVDARCALVPGGAALSGDDANYDVVGAWFRVQAGGTTDTAPDFTRWMAVCSNSARP